VAGPGRCRSRSASAGGGLGLAAGWSGLECVGGALEDLSEVVGVRMSGGSRAEGAGWLSGARRQMRGCS